MILRLTRNDGAPWFVSVDGVCCWSQDVEQPSFTRVEHQAGYQLVQEAPETIDRMIARGTT